MFKNVKESRNMLNIEKYEKNKNDSNQTSSDKNTISKIKNTVDGITDYFFLHFRRKKLLKLKI